MNIKCIKCKKLFLEEQMAKDLPTLCKRCWELEKLDEYALHHTITVVNPTLITINDDEGFNFNLNNYPKRK